MLDFPVGVASETFTVPIVDHGVQSVSKTIQVSLFGPSPIGMASPSKAVLTILNDDLSPRAEPAEPAGPPGRSGERQPAVGRHVLRRPQSDAAHGDAAVSRDRDDRAGARHGAVRQLQLRIQRRPEHPDRGVRVSLPRGGRAAGHRPACWPLTGTGARAAAATASDPPADGGRLRQLHQRASPQGSASYRAVLFLEMDSIITMPCLSRHGQAVREHELRYAINTLTADCPHLVVYLDAGAADALSARRPAKFLRASGVANDPGLLPERHPFDWTSNEIRYGEQISRLTGGKHFVVNTGENGQGPLRPRDIVHQGNEVLCNPPGRGLGPLPERQHRLSQRRHVRLDEQPGRVRRQLRARRPADRRVLARLRADARAQRRLQVRYAGSPRGRSSPTPRPGRRPSGRRAVRGPRRRPARASSSWSARAGQAEGRRRRDTPAGASGSGA